MSSAFFISACPGLVVERLVEIGEEVLDILDPDRQPHEVGGDTGGLLLRFVELLVCGRCRMNGERLGIANVGEVTEQLEAIDELTSGFESAFEAESDQRGVGAWGEIFRGCGVMCVVC